MSIHIEHLLVDLLNSATKPSAHTLWIVDESLSTAHLRSVRPKDSLHVLTNRIDLATLLKEAGHQVFVSDFDFSVLPVTQYADIVYRVAKERPLVHHCINESYRALLPQGSLHLIGTKDEGIRTHGRKAEQLFGNPEHAKKHGDTYHIRLEKPQETAQSTAEFLDSKEYGHLRPCTVGDFHFISKPGVFGWNKVDRGSAMLAAYALKILGQNQKKSAGSVLDLGCGYGYLLLVTAGIPFSSRTATDNNAAAVDAAKASFARAHLNVDVSLDDCGEALTGSYDWILCNPPFHQGFDTSSQLTDKFITQIRRLLAPQGKALLVVNQFIPIERLAEDKFAHIDVVSHEQGFKIVQLS